MRQTTNKTARSAGLQRGDRKAIGVITVIAGLVAIVGCNIFTRSQGASRHSIGTTVTFGAATNAKVLQALHLYIDKTPLFFAVAAKQSIFRTALIDRDLVKHQIVLLSPLKENNGQTDLLNMRVGPLGMALLRRVHASRYLMNGALVYVVEVGRREVNKEINVKMVSLHGGTRGAVNRCAKVAFTSTLILNRAGVDLVAVASPSHRLSVGLPRENMLITGGTEFGPTFSDAGKQVKGSLLVCEMTSGGWRVYFPICRLCK